MQIYKIFIISNVDEEIQEIGSLLKKVPFLSTTISASSYLETTENMSLTFPDLIFVNSATLSQEEIYLLHLASPKTPIILIGDEKKTSEQCFSQGIAVDYINRSITFERLIVALNRALPYHISFGSIQGPDFVFLKIGRTYKKFFLDEIVYIEAYGIYVKVITENNKFTVNDTISKLEERLSGCSFMRVHKSFIINTKKINSFDSAHFELTIGKIPIGPRYKPNIEGLLNMLSKAFD